MLLQWRNESWNSHGRNNSTNINKIGNKLDIVVIDTTYYILNVYWNKNTKLILIKKNPQQVVKVGQASEYARQQAGETGAQNGVSRGLLETAV